jgi:hypothetical protein
MTRGGPGGLPPWLGNREHGFGWFGMVKLSQVRVGIKLNQVEVQSPITIGRSWVVEVGSETEQHRPTAWVTSRLASLVVLDLFCWT